MATDFGQNLRNDHSAGWHFAMDSQFRFGGDKAHNFCYILCNFDEDRSTNPKDHACSSYTFCDEMAKIDISYQISQQVLDRTSTLFSIGRLMYADYEIEIIFAVVEETLLW